MDEEEPPFKRRRPPPFIRRRNTILMLPDDLILNCLARVSRLYYPTLSLVSKRFRSLLASTELYQTRTLLGCTESCLYVYLQTRNTLGWFTLCRRPHSSRNLLVPVSSSPGSPTASKSGVAVVGHNIYILGGLINNTASSSVRVIDCRSHTSHEAPSMQIARVKNLNSTNWMEVFDTKTQTWEFLQIPREELCGGYKYVSVGYEGTLYVMSKPKHAACKLSKGRWRAADLAMGIGWDCSLSYCVIANVFYRCASMTIDWYDPTERLWKTLKGLERLPTFSRNAHVKLTDFGGKMAVLWEEYVSINKHQDKIIWCAEVAIEKRQNGEIWGTLNWCDVVSTTNEPYSLVHALATTI